MKKRKIHGEFALTSEFSDKQFTNYSKYLVSIWTSSSPNDWYHKKPIGVGRLR